jgi:alpha-2-macroglobulin
MRTILLRSLWLLILIGGLSWKGSAAATFEVAAVTPAALTGDLDPQAAQIVVAFDHPIVPLVSNENRDTLPDPLTLEPDVPGRGEWVTTSLYLFHPDETLLADTEYTATVHAGLQAVDGSVLEHDYIWSFRTFAPQTLQIAATHLLYPRRTDTDLLPDSGFAVTFSQPMDRASTEAAFHLIRRPDEGEDEALEMSGTFKWNASSTRLTFTPDDYLLNYRYYEVSVETTARNANGSAVLKEPASSLFWTVGRPRASINTHQVEPGRVTLRFEFNTFINKNTFAGHYSIEPQPEGEVATYYGAQSFSLVFNAADKVEYAITLDDEIEDLYGRTMFDDAVFVVESRAPEPPKTLTGSYEFAPRYPIVIIGTYPETPFLPVTVSGKATLTWEIYGFEPSMLAAYSEEQRESMVGSGRDHFTDSLQIIRFNEGYNAETPWEPIPITPAWQTDENRLYSWTQTLHEPVDVNDILQIAAELAHVPPADVYESNTVNVPLNLPDGTVLAPGIYGVRLTPDDATGADTFANTGWGGDRSGIVLVVSDVAISIRRSAVNSLIWVTDLQTAQPAAGVTVKAYAPEGSRTLGTTNEDGVLQVDGTIPDYVTVEGDGHYGMWLDWSIQSEWDTSNTIYTDRPIYRPGETVYFRGIVRDTGDSRYGVPDIDVLYADVGQRDWNTNEFITLDELTFTVSEYGTYSGSWTLPRDAALDGFVLRVSSCPLAQQGCAAETVYGEFGREYISPDYYGSASFNVAEFRVPEFAVSVEAEKEEFIALDMITANVTARYYSGGAVSSAQVKVEASVPYNYYGRASTFFDYRGAEKGFRFGNRYYWDYWNIYDGYFEQVGAGGKTDTEGNFLFQRAGAHTGTLPEDVTLYATVTDASGQAITATDTVIVHPAAVYIGLRPEESFFPVNQSTPVNIISVGIDSAPVPNQVIQLEVIEKRWTYTKRPDRTYYDWYLEDIPHQTTTRTTNSAGKATFVFDAPRQGEFYLRATTTDERGRQAQTTIRLYALPAREETHFGGDPFIYNQPCGYTTEYRELAMSIDAESYSPGDIAQIYIPNPFEDTVTALVTIERGSVIQYDMVEIHGASYNYTLPITPDHEPNIFVEVLLVQGISADHPDPLYERGRIELKVEPVTKRLNIEITPSAETARPGDTVNIRVRVTDWQGNPVQAEVGVAVTDEAALAIASSSDRTLEQVYYSAQGLGVSNSTSLKLLMTNPIYDWDAGCGGGGGGIESGELLLRDDFIYTPLWTAVITDENGIGEVAVTLPDNLTRWRIDARATTKDTLVGQATYTFTSTLPLVVRPIAPRFFVAGDSVPVAATVHNNSDEPQTVTVSAQVDGIVLELDAPQTYELPPYGQVKAAWWGQVAEGVTGVDIIIIARAASGLQDAARPILRTTEDGKIPVYAYVAPDTVRTAGVLTEGERVTEQILLPEQFSELDAALEIGVQSSLASVTLDSLDYLKNYPHQCIEQTVSRFLPNVVTYQTLHDFGITDDALEENLLSALDFSLQRLARDQNEDGGWGWFTRMTSNPLTTAYALIGLAQVRDAGLPVDETMAKKAATYLHEQLNSRLSLRLSNYELSRYAVALYALSLWEADSPALERDAASLFERHANLSYSSRAFLLLTLHQINPESDIIDALVSDFTSTALIQASGTSWREPSPYGWNWDSDTRTTALVLTALTRVQPDHPLLPGAVRWLVTARSGDHWETTQETAWAVLALSDWMRATHEQEGEFSYRVLLNDVLLKQGSAAPEQTPVDETLMLTDMLKADNKLEIARSGGKGSLYYTATLKLQLPADEVGAFSSGIFVERQYLQGSTPESTTPVTEPKMGDTVTVRLNVTLTEDVNYFVLEDWLPAGFEPIDSRLLTTGNTGSAPALNCLYPGKTYWCYAAWYFDHTELRDTGLQLYAEYLPRGAYVFSYQARVVTPGTFQVIPAQAYAFYQPEIYGRSTGMQVLISE